MFPFLISFYSHLWIFSNEIVKDRRPWETKRHAKVNGWDQMEAV